MGTVCPNLPQVGDRIAYKKTNTNRDKWRYGEILKTEVRGAWSRKDISQVQWKDKNGRNCGKSHIPMGSQNEPRVIIFTREAELPVDLLAWCKINHVLAVRPPWGAKAWFIFVDEKAPHDEICLRDRSTQLACVEYHPDDAKFADPTLWHNSSFELASSEVDMVVGDRQIDYPEDFEPEFE